MPEIIIGVRVHFPDATARFYGEANRYEAKPDGTLDVLASDRFGSVCTYAAGAWAHAEQVYGDPATDPAVDNARATVESIRSGIDQVERDQAVKVAEETMDASLTVLRESEERLRMTQGQYAAAVQDVEGARTALKKAMRAARDWRNGRPA